MLITNLYEFQKNFLIELFMHGFHFFPIIFKKYLSIVLLWK